MAIINKILSLTRQLYPTGRAFKAPVNGYLDKLHQALALSEKRAYDDAVSILNSSLPDNEMFTAADATAWEKRYGLISNQAVPLADRKLAIIRKMNHPGKIKPRQNFRYLEGQLRAAGFNVYVYENRFPDGAGGYITKTPTELGGIATKTIQYGDAQYGDIQMGSIVEDKVVNYIDDSIDAFFNVGDNLRSTFFIGGNPLGTYADVDAFRKEEFRQLILRIKPTQTVGFLFINYV
jgi:hypothetical protein